MHLIPVGLHVQLLQAKEAAEADSRAKGEFLANLSNEIRLAMHNIINMTEAVLTTELKSEQRRDLSAVRDSANTLLRMIEDVLDSLKSAAP